MNDVYLFKVTLNKFSAKITYLEAFLLCRRTTQYSIDQ